ncbi:hypothetical protein L3Y34_011285 [Caenorhabditis briggsae]|uniref:Uncharacterized protein n=1 Tax=Caenorhabditis briggsae TaxID=6238 RepID=A0AAE8ZLE8_CAEBR|nr:hypothetical protein L3Y34_011285 [Caenorhabditis briggsae]
MLEAVVVILGDETTISFQLPNASNIFDTLFHIHHLPSYPTEHLQSSPTSQHTTSNSKCFNSTWCQTWDVSRKLRKLPLIRNVV